MIVDVENLRIGIAGNIGVGKSTLIETLQKKPYCDMLLERYPSQYNDAKVCTFPEQFTDEVLTAFYKNPKKMAFIAQLEFLNARLERQTKIGQVRGIIMEDRTLYEDYHIFGKAQKVLNNMTPEEFLVYQRNYRLMTAKVPEPDLVVYLRAKSKTLKKRIKTRGRPSEQSIPADYLDLLNGLYEEFISRHVNCPVLIIDADDEVPLNDYVLKTTKKIADKIDEMKLRVSTKGIQDWVTMPETEAALRAIEAERRLEDYLKHNKKLITVSGNVGLGKSTITALMHQSLRIKALYEKPEKNPLLEQFLHNKKAHCFDLQMYFLKMRAEQRKIGKSGDQSYIKDRSLPEDILIFSQQFYNDGILSDREMDLLTAEFRKVNKTLPQPDTMILLQGKPELAWDRILQRGRKMEMDGGWTLGEIKALNKLYKTYAEDVTNFGYYDNPIITLDTNQLDLTNRVHMGYLFELTYNALRESV